jgi:hypothetical protein
MADLGQAMAGFAAERRVFNPRIGSSSVMMSTMLAYLRLMISEFEQLTIFHVCAADRGPADDYDRHGIPIWSGARSKNKPAD